MKLSDCMTSEECSEKTREIEARIYNPDNAKPAVLVESNVPENFPTIHSISDYDLDGFIKVEEADDDKKTTESDLGILNNGLALVNAMFPHARTIDGLCKLCLTATKMIETRRAVKKLPMGQSKDTAKQRTFEVLE